VIRPFFSYYGGKWRNAPRQYPPPSRDLIVEPFAGSAGYATRYHDRGVVLCDSDPAVAAVWRFLISATKSDILAIPDLPHGLSVDDLGLDPGPAALVGFWLNRGGARPKKRASAWMRSGARTRPGSYWGGVVRNRLAAQVEKINHWRFVEGDYTCTESAGDATWFIDPPYRSAGKHYRHGSSRIDYNELASWCRRRRGQVIVCEQAGARWLPFSVVGTNKTARRDRRCCEVAWFNNEGKANDGSSE